jgi:tetratricopeptide (TPR) repeat protein
LSDRATSRESLLDLLDRLSERTRAGLGEGRDEVSRASVQLGQAMTRNLDAYQHYLAGQEAWLRDGLRAVGLAEFREALRLDPGFAPAHSDLAQLLQSYGRVDLAEPHWKAAQENLERTPAKEQLVLRLRVAHGTEARQLAEEAVRRYPVDKHVLAEAADAFEVLALPEPRDAALRTALELDPAYWAAARHLSARLAKRTDEALEVARRAVATRRSAVNLTLLAEALHATGAVDEGRAAAREALTMAGGRSTLVAERACFVLWQSGADAECQGVWERMKVEATEPLERDAASTRLVEALFVKGRVKEGRGLAALLDEPTKRVSWRATYMHTIGHERSRPPAQALAAARRLPPSMMKRNFLAWFGEMDEAERVDAKLVNSSSWGGVAQQIYEATRLAAEGSFAEAAKLAWTAYEVSHQLNSPAWAWSRAAFTAEMLLADGRHADVLAIEAPALPCRCRDPIDYAASYPSFALYRAQAMQQLGRPGDAASELDDVIAFWKDGDPDLPLLAEAKAMRARLAAAAR